MFGRKKGAKGTKENPIVIGPKGNYYVISWPVSGPFETAAEAEIAAQKACQPSNVGGYWYPPRKHWVMEAVAEVDPMNTAPTITRLV